MKHRTYFCEKMQDKFHHVTRQDIVNALGKHMGNRTKAGRELGMSSQTFYRHCSLHNIALPPAIISQKKITDDDVALMIQLRDYFHVDYQVIADKFEYGITGTDVRKICEHYGGYHKKDGSVNGN